MLTRKNLAFRIFQSKKFCEFSVNITNRQANFALGLFQFNNSKINMKIKKESKTVWILLPNLGLGGAEVFLTSLVSELHQDYDFIFFVNDNKVNIKNIPANIKAHSNTISFVIHILASSWKSPPDIILSSIFDINIISLLLKKLIPGKIKHIIREAVSLEEACELTRSPIFSRWLAGQLYPWADAIINLSNDLLENLEKRMPAIGSQTRHLVIPNGVPKSRMQTFPLRNYSAKKIVAIGRLEYQKGFDQLISAFAEFSANNHGYELIIIGEGNLRTELQKQIDGCSQNGIIRLIGEKEDPIPDLCTAGFFALPSRYEGLSNAMLEALVNGVPVLATKANTSAAQVIDESNGILIDRCAEDQILKGLHEMVQKINHFSREDIAVAARKRFSITSSAKSYSSVFDDI
jgi:glycosyltransferase involved in cell wall biosynthesis